MGAIGIAQQVLIYSNHDPALSSEPTAIFPRRVVLPFLLVYLAVSLRMLWTDTLAALVQLRPVVQITDAEYDAHMQWTLQIPRRDTLLLFGIILVFNIVVYGVQGVSMPLAMAQTLPRDLPAAAFILGTLILLGWLLVYLVYVSVRYSLGLHRLAQQPLTINVLDPYALLPFGRLALLYSLTLVGLILILIVPLGLPTVFDEYLVVFLATLGSFLALIVPLWGVHRQIQAAKQEVLGKIHQQFREVQDILLDGSYFEKEELDDLSDRTEKLTKLRKLVWDAPNWPFKTWAGVFRAALAALIPVILIVLQEIVKFYIGFLLGSPSGP